MDNQLRSAIIEPCLFTDPESTRKKLDDLVLDGYILHGSPVTGLDILVASETGFMHKDKDGKDVPKEPLVCGTTDVDYAVFFAAVHAVARNERKAGKPNSHLLKSSTLDEWDENGEFIRQAYFVSNALKRFVKKREALGESSAVYWYPSEGLTFREDERDWITPKNVRPLGALSVSVACLSFDFYALPHPNSNPTIRKYNAAAGVDLSVDF